MAIPWRQKHMATDLFKNSWRITKGIPKFWITVLCLTDWVSAGRWMHRDAFPSMHVKTAAHTAPHTPPSLPHCAPHRALRIFLLNSSVIPLMGIFLCEIRKFYASSEKQAESCMTQINCIANWAAAPFFLRKPQQQIVWTKHTAALTRRVIHKWLSFTGVPLFFVSAKRKALSISIWRGLQCKLYTFQFNTCKQ